MTITTAQMDGWFKRVYEKYENAVPNFAKVRKLAKFVTEKRQGDSFRFPVKLTRSHGITWNGGSTAGTAFTLNAAVSMTTKEANLSGSEFILREQISYGAISRSGSAEGGYGPIMDEVPLDMAESANFYLEMALLYGGTDIGTVSGDPGGGPNARAVTISIPTWTPGIWAQMEGAFVDFWSAGYAALLRLSR